MLVAGVSSDFLATISAVTAGFVVAGHFVAAFDRARKAKKTDQQVGEVRTAVNSRLDNALAQVAALTKQVERLEREAAAAHRDAEARERLSDA